MIFSFYLSLLAFLYLYLSFLVIQGRISGRISIGTGGDERFERKVRAHGNFVETVPVAALLLFALEYQQASVYLLHAAWLLLIAGRVIHPLGMVRTTGNFRVIGMILTYASTALGAVFNLYFGVIGVF